MATVYKHHPPFGDKRETATTVCGKKPSTVDRLLLTTEYAELTCTTCRNILRDHRECTACKGVGRAAGNYKCRYCKGKGMIYEKRPDGP